MVAAMVDICDIEASLEDGEDHGDEWQTECRMMKQRGAHLLQTAMWADCTFVVGPEKVQMRAHKLMLSMASPVFEEMFFGATDPVGETIRILCEANAFEALLNYIYTENITICSYNTAYGVYVAAHKYMVPQLARVCAMFMACNLTTEYALHALQAGRHYGEQQLVDESLQLIAEHTREILAQPGFLALNMAAVVTIFSQDNLRVTSELELFRALVLYAKNRTQRDGEGGKLEGPAVKPEAGPNEAEKKKEHIEMDDEEDGVGDKNDAPSPVSGIRKALEQLRFLTLTAEEFASGPARSGLLSQQEAFAVLMNIANVSVPMPEGFSACKDPRWRQGPAPSAPQPPPPCPPPLAPRSLSFRLLVSVAGAGPTRAPPSIASLSQPYLGASWVARMVPRVSTASNKEYSVALGFYVKCETPPPPPWSRRVRLRCRLQAGEPAQPPRTLETLHTFTSAEPEHGFPQFIQMQEALAGYARGDRIDVEITVRAEEDPRAATDPDPDPPVGEQSTDSD